MTQCDVDETKIDEQIDEPIDVEMESEFSLYKIASGLKSIFGSNSDNTENKIIELLEKHEFNKNYQTNIKCLFGKDRHTEAVLGYESLDWQICLLIKIFREYFGIDIHFDNEFLLSRILELYGTNTVLKYLLEKCGCDFNLCYRQRLQESATSVTGDSEYTSSLRINLTCEIIQTLLDHDVDLQFLFDPSSKNHFYKLMPDKDDYIDCTDTDEEETSIRNILKQLLIKGYKPDELTLSVAIANKLLTVVELLLNTGEFASIDEIALFEIIFSRNVDMLKLLLNHHIKFDIKALKTTSNNDRQIINVLKDFGYESDDIVSLLFSVVYVAIEKYNY
jgi:hypothetical protein